MGCNHLLCEQTSFELLPSSIESQTHIKLHGNHSNGLQNIFLQRVRAWSPLKDFSLLPPPNQNKPMGKSLYQSLKRTLCEIPVEDFMNENLGIVVVHDLSLGHSSLTNLSHRVLSVPRTSLLHNIVKVHLQKSTKY